MNAFLALLPIALILWLMIARGRSAAVAGVAGLLTALVIAFGAFDFGGAMPTDATGRPTGPAPGPALALGGSLLEALFVAGTIVWIVLPALCIHELQSRRGMVTVMRQALAGLSTDPRITALIVAWFFALFLEGAAGFGTPVALAAPILVGLGFPPVAAVSMALIGHAAGVSFGAIGTPVVPQVAAGDLDPLALAGRIGLMHALLGAVLLIFVMRIAGREGPRAAAVATAAISGPGIWAWGGLAALLFLLPFLAIAVWLGPELPTLGGALIGGLAFVLILRRVRGGGRAEAPVAVGTLLRALLPYGVLLALILASRLVPPLREALTAPLLRWDLAGMFSGEMRPFYHPGTMLFVGFLLGGLLQGARLADLAAAAVAAMRRLLPVLVALTAMLALSRIMVQAGMVEVLAAQAARLFGFAWPMLAPAVGALGTFITGSATTSNILFSDFQRATAVALGLPVLLMMAGQGFGAAVGNIICPHNIIAGGATVGLVGREGDVLRRVALPAASYVLLGGLLLAAFVWIGI